MFNIYLTDADKLVNALKNYPRDAEEAINSVFHSEEVDRLAQDAIKRLMPRSNKKNGRHAKDSNSLRKLDGNLSVTIRTQKSFQYLYFPDDGTNTRRHIGNQRFFARGGEAIQGDIIDKCVDELTKDFK